MENEFSRMQMLVGEQALNKLKNMRVQFLALEELAVMLPKLLPAAEFLILI